MMKKTGVIIVILIIVLVIGGGLAWYLKNDREVEIAEVEVEKVEVGEVPVEMVETPIKEEELVESEIKAAIYHYDIERGFADAGTEEKGYTQELVLQDVRLDGNYATAEVGQVSEVGGYRAYLKREEDSLTMKVLLTTQDLLDCDEAAGLGLPASITERCYINNADGTSAIQDMTGTETVVVGR